MIPGPSETQAQFTIRKKSMETATYAFKKKYPKRAIQTIDGIPVYIGKKGLKFWESGALWVYENNCNERLPLIQLKKKNTETLAHEKIHALRIAFDENRFEEILAYLTSKKRWRKKWGPLLRSHISVWIFLSLSFLSILHPFCIFLPICCLAIQALRLTRDRNKLLNVISKLGSFDYALYLTDREIMAFAKMEKNQIIDFLDRNQKLSFRIYKLKQLMSYVS